MEGNKFIARVNFEAEKHHRQVLRAQIKTETIDKIEIADNPSQNYQKAYRALYYDELDKQMDQRNLRKSLDQTNEKFNKQTGKNHSVYQPNSNGLKNRISDGVSNNNMYVDYFAERNNKFNDLIEKNYDAGQSFYKNYEKYQDQKLFRNQTHAQILKNQMKIKQNKKMQEDQKRRLQTETLKYYRQIQQEMDCQNIRRTKHQKDVVKDQILGQAEIERQKRQRKSLFEYNKATRHNPITNPIEYHIDNPYILKRIQNRGVDNLLKLR